MGSEGEVEHLNAAAIGGECCCARAVLCERCGVQVITVDSLNLMRARLLILEIEGMELDAIQAISL